ncbi:MAG: hypothetical protein JXL97_14465 [Bacteroidales bacterium]|nr:hypothetical protein [Bacteroidales bacterium]
MSKSLMLLVALLFSINVFLNAQNSFPGNWLGEWDGYMFWYKETKLVDSIHAGLTIKKTDVDTAWTWKTSYYAKDTIIKDYILRKKEENWYLIDEGEGIFLNAFLVNNQLISMFTVENKPLPAVYTLNKNILTFEISMWEKQGKVNEQIDDFVLKSYQKAVLKRKE